MSVKFKPVKRVNLRNLTLQHRYYAHLEAGDDVSFDELVDQTAELSTVNTGDIIGVIATLIKVIAYELKFGRVIRLGDMGTFYLSIQSEGADTAEELTAANIHRAVLRFRPSRKLSGILRNLQFEKVGNGNQNGQTDDANEGKPAPAGVDVTPNEHDG